MDEDNTLKHINSKQKMKHMDTSQTMWNKKFLKNNISKCKTNKSDKKIILTKNYQ